MTKPIYLTLASFIVSIGFLPCLNMAKAQGTTIACSKMIKATPQDSLAYLKGDRSALDSDCIEIALQNLGDVRYLPAIPTLIQYLDFKKKGPGRDAARVLGDAYPAATALEQIGKLAIPDVKAAVENESLNRLQRRNAAALYADGLSQDWPANIRFLVQASKKSKDAQVALDLIDMAKELADGCPTSDQDQCQMALNGN